MKTIFGFGVCAKPAAENKTKIRTSETRCTAAAESTSRSVSNLRCILPDGSTKKLRHEAAPPLAAVRRRRVHRHRARGAASWPRVRSLDRRHVFRRLSPAELHTEVGHPCGPK